MTNQDGYGNKGNAMRVHHREYNHKTKSKQKIYTTKNGNKDSSE